MNDLKMFLIKHREGSLECNNQFLVVLARDREDAKAKGRLVRFPGNSDQWIVDPQTEVVRFTVNRMP